MRPAASILLSVPLFFACSATTASKFDSSTSSGNGSGNGSGAGAGSSISVGVGGTDFSGSGAATTSSGDPGGCSEAATYVYVLSTDNDMYSFQPDKKAFTKIGHLGCPTTMVPNSMAVDRNATAWVNYVQTDGLNDTGGALYAVSTKDASCQGLQANLPNGWYRLGMGYSSDTNGGESESLFLTGTNGGPGLAKYNPAKKSVDFIGQFSGSLTGQNAELTGTGDGRLFGFFTTFPVEVAEINKGSGAILSTRSLSQVPTPSAWAFSFWGGDFYLYTSDGFSNSRVSRYRPSDKSVITDYMANVGFIIVGAGVSTCAPVEPPK